HRAARRPEIPRLCRPVRSEWRTATLGRARLARIPGAEPRGRCAVLLVRRHEARRPASLVRGCGSLGRASLLPRGGSHRRGGGGAPSFGCGLSLALRDVRVLRDRLLAEEDWDKAAHAYADEHDRHYGAIHRITGWMRTMFYDTRPEAAAIRNRAMPRL